MREREREGERQLDSIKLPRDCNSIVLGDKNGGNTQEEFEGHYVALLQVINTQGKKWMALYHVEYL